MYKSVGYILLLTALTVFADTHSIITNEAEIAAVTTPELVITTPVLIFDGDPSLKYPHNFRSTHDLSALTEVNTRGLNELHMMGGAEFTVRQLRHIIKYNSAPLMIVDLRQESHGFINGLPISWYAPRDWANVDKTPAQVEQDQRDRLAALHIGDTVTVNQIKVDSDTGEIIADSPQTLFIKGVDSEQALARYYGLAYQRFYVTDHRAPNAEQVDNFVAFVNRLPADTWLYFHCRAGVGRTTTFMVMYDILRNGKTVPLADILKRQYLLGGKDLANLSTITGYKYSYADERLAFIKNFYDYVKTNNDRFNTRWSEWQETRH